MHKSLPPLAPAPTQSLDRRQALASAVPLEILLIGAAFFVLIFG